MKRFKTETYTKTYAGGKQITETQTNQDGLYCDFCGEAIDYEDPGANYLSFTINEESGSEESWYYKEFENLPEEKKWGTFEFWANQPNYHYCVHEDYDESCSGMMISDIKADMLSEVMQDNRVRVVDELLKKGVTPEELGFDQ